MLKIIVVHQQFIVVMCFKFLYNIVKLQIMRICSLHEVKLNFIFCFYYTYDMIHNFSVGFSVFSLISFQIARSCSSVLFLLQQSCCLVLFLSHSCLIFLMVRILCFPLIFDLDLVSKDTSFPRHVTSCVDCRFVSSTFQFYLFPWTSLST